MKKHFFFAIIAAAIIVSQTKIIESQEQGYLLKKSVVEIKVTFQEPDYDRPWQMKKSVRKWDSGVIIEGKRILTNTHVVDDSQFIKVRKSTEDDYYEAQVEYIGYDSDLAIIKVDGNNFLKETVAAKIGDLPKLRDKVSNPLLLQHLFIIDTIINCIFHSPYQYLEVTG